MILSNDNYVVYSRNSNTHYWEQGIFPTWTAINTLLWIPGQQKGAGVEPHYHDCDEFWLFTAGHGEVWIDGQSFEVTPNTAVYTPMGAVHRFQMFTDFANVPVVTPLERQKRATHLLVEEDGPPEPTVPGFVIPGSANKGPFADRGQRCPLSELRLLDLPAGKGLEEEKLHANEHWVITTGSILLSVEGVQAKLVEGDVALLRAGALRWLSTEEGASVALAREVVG